MKISNTQHHLVVNVSWSVLKLKNEAETEQHNARIWYIKSLKTESTVLSQRTRLLWRKVLLHRWKCSKQCQSKCAWPFEYTLWTSDVGATSSAAQEVALEPAFCDGANHIFLEIAAEMITFACLYHTDVKRSGEEVRDKTRAAGRSKLSSVTSNQSKQMSREQVEIEVMPTEK